MLVSLLVLVGCATDDGGRERLRGRVSVAYLDLLFNDRSTMVKDDIWIEGVVIATDKLGEVEHCFVMEDDSGGVEVKVDASDVDVLVPLYSYVRIHCSGLALGREGGKLVLGEPPTSQYVVDRIDPTRIYSYVSLLDDVDYEVDPLPCGLADVGERNMLRYVVIEGVRFVEDEVFGAWCATDSLDRYVTTLHPLTDGRDTIDVVAASTMHYASEPMPRGMITYRGMVDSYGGEIVLRTINHQML